MALPLAAAAAVLDKGWLPLPPAAAEWVAWKGLPIVLLLALGGLLLLSDFARHHALLGPLTNPIMLPMKVAFRLHLVALLAAALEFWLALRRSWNQPLPKIEMRW